MDAVAALSALDQDNRLDIYRLLVQAGPGGMAAGKVAEALGIAPNTLSFHFDRLRRAGLVSVAREGRSLIYAARFETMNNLLGYLTEIGSGVTMDLERAAQLYRMGCEGGNGTGCTNLGLMYEYGRGVGKSVAKARAARRVGK